MKLYCLWDMEGVSGLYTREHCWYWEPGVRPSVAEEGRRLLTADVNRATTAALEAGATELIICDTHHGGGNFLWEELLADPRIRYETPRPDAMMPGLDESVAGLLLLGHHAKAGTADAFMDHTWGPWFDVHINGMSVGEIGLESCYAGHWDVPLVLVQGDDACCREAETQFPGVVTACVKQGLSFAKAAGPAPQIGRDLTARRVGEAVAALAGGTPFRPFKPSLPMTVQITLRTTEEAERAARRLGVTRLDGRTVCATVDRQCDVLRWII